MTVDTPSRPGRPWWRRLDARDLFQALSYLQYPMMLVAAVFTVQAVLAMLDVRATGWGPVIERLNDVLLYAGVGIGLSSMQDPRRTQNAVSLRTWRDPAKGRLALWVIALEAFVPIVVGLVGAAQADDSALRQLSLGLVAFGLGMLGLLKTAIEMREHHRIDRQPDQEHAP